MRTRWLLHPALGWRGPVGDNLPWCLSEPVEGLHSGEYLCVRVLDVDGGAAWSSPFFVD